MTKSRLFKELFVMSITLLALYHAGRSIVGSIDRQMFLHKQSVSLQDGQKQAQDINKELRDGLSSYRSSTGVERLARERLNLAGPDEVIVRLGK